MSTTYPPLSMPLLSRMPLLKLLAGVFIAAVFVPECFAQKPDYSEQTLAKLRPLNVAAESASKDKDYPAAFEAYQKMYSISRIPECRTQAIGMCWKSVDFGKVDRGASQTKSVTSIAERCPSPLPVDKALVHFEFAMIQMALVTQKVNIDRSFDAAALNLAKSEAHWEMAQQLDPKFVSQADSAAFLKNFRDARRTITHNKGVEAYNKILNGVKSMMKH